MTPKSIQTPIFKNTCNGNVSEPSELLTDSDNNSESVNNDSEAYVYPDGYFKAQPSCTEPKSENYYEDATRQLEDLKSRFRTYTENLNSKYEKETEEHQIIQDKFTAMNEEVKIDFEVRNFENANKVKEKLIVSQRKTIIEDYDEKLLGLYGK